MTQMIETQNLESPLSTIEPPQHLPTTTNPTTPQKNHKLTLIPLIFLIYFEVAGGPYGEEPAVKAAGPLLAILGFLIFPFIWSVPEALITAELSTTFPGNGGFVIWADKAFGPFWGSLMGSWKFLTGVINIASFPVLCISYLEEIFPVLDSGVPRKLAILGSTLFLSLVNYTGLTIVGYVAVALGVISLAPFIIMSLIAIPKIHPHRWLSLGQKGVKKDWNLFFNTLFWNLNFWDNVSTMAGEVENPRKTFPLALFSSVVFTCSGYIIPLMAVTGAVDVDQRDWDTGFMANAAEMISGKWLKFWIEIGAVLSIKYACSNAKTEDLWSVLQEESGEPVNKLMNSWTKQQGYPVVSVNINDQKLECEQTQFLLSGSHGDGQWIVPLTLCCGSYEARKSFLMLEKSEVLDVKDLLGSSSSKGNPWIKVNVEQTGFYRVKYDDELSARLRYAIERKVLSTNDKYGILDDSYALSMACHQSLSSLLALMASFREELDYTVLSNLISISYKVARIVAEAVPDLQNHIKLFFINLFQFSAERLGWDPKEGESHLDAMLRGELLNALASFGHDETINEAVRRFRIFLDDRNTAVLPPDLRKAVYVAVMQRVNKSDRSGFESLLRIYRETDLSQEKTRILGSLASCRDPEIILEVLNFLLCSEVRSQDCVYGLAVSFEGRETAWNWLKEKWDHIHKTFGSGFLLTRFISATVSPFSSYEKAKEVEEFFASRTKPYIARTLKQSIERVHINANWVQSIQKEKNLPEAVTELAYRKY